MTGILLSCRRCGKQVFSSQVRDGLCLDCRVDAAVADLRDEHVRLWRKRDRYAARGANARSIAPQVARLEERMAARIAALVPEEKAAEEQMRRTLEKARAARYEVRRIR